MSTTKNQTIVIAQTNLNLSVQLEYNFDWWFSLCRRDSRETDNEIVQLAFMK